ncbi:MAG: hypothetical protein HQL42_15590 [Alphaproteobacteria bacterium]|nr:hypothetical protein [Alphaproteobacteria bacterium]
MSTAIDYSSIPVPTLAHDVRLYVEQGQQPNAFLMALFSNDLRGAHAHADETCRSRLSELIGWCEEYMPVRCWGTKPIVMRWLAGQANDTPARQLLAA